MRAVFHVMLSSMPVMAFGKDQSYQSFQKRTPCLPAGPCYRSSARLLHGQQLQKVAVQAACFARTSSAASGFSFAEIMDDPVLHSSLSVVRVVDDDFFGKAYRRATCGAKQKFGGKITCGNTASIVFGIGLSGLRALAVCSRSMGKGHGQCGRAQRRSFRRLRQSVKRALSRSSICAIRTKMYAKCDGLRTL